MLKLQKRNCDRKNEEMDVKLGKFRRASNFTGIIDPPKTEKGGEGEGIGTDRSGDGETGGGARKAEADRSWMNGRRRRSILKP